MTPNKKVLIITYYWPPSGGSGVQRWLKFVKYLPSFGWEPYVFTPANPSFTVQDESLEKDVPGEAEVIKFPIREPYAFFGRVSKMFHKGIPSSEVDFLSGKKASVFKRVSTWIRGNFFVPDPRIFWVRPSVRFLRDFLKDNHIRIVVTTGPPHSVHLIGYNLRKKDPGLTWLADFRDPWSEWGLLDSLNVTPAVRKIHQRMERKVLESADALTTITPFYVRRFEQLSKRHVHLLTNGYDEGDFKDIRFEEQKKFIIRHVGTVNEKCDPAPFIDVLAGMARANEGFGKDVHLDFIGEVNSDFKNYVRKHPSAERITSFTGTVSHRTLLQFYGSSSLLLIVLYGYKDAEGFMPGKLFEYIATGLPVVGIGPEEGDAAWLLNECKCGRMFDPAKKREISEYVLSVYDRWKSGSSSKNASPPDSRYSRRSVTGQLVQILEGSGKVI